MNSNKIANKTQIDILKQISRMARIIKDDVKQLSFFCHWAVRAKYLIELYICWQLQGFKYDSNIDKKLLPLSQELAIQEIDETNKQISEIRKEQYRAGLKCGKQLKILNTRKK